MACAESLHIRITCADRKCADRKCADRKRADRKCVRFF